MRYSEDMAYFYEDPSEGAIEQRDKFQFELKSEYSPLQELKQNRYVLELYLFIPGALQINPTTYSKEEFYHDITSLIRFKTPGLSLKQLIDPNCKSSPFFILNALLRKEGDLEKTAVKDELKIFGNIVRSRVRDTVNGFIQDMQEGETEDLPIKIQNFCKDIEQLRKFMLEYRREFTSLCTNRLLHTYYNYLDEFCGLNIEGYLTKLLSALKESEQPELGAVCQKVMQGIFFEQELRRERGYKSSTNFQDKKKTEEFLYRSGLLNKFMLESLRLSISRKEATRYFNQFMASIAAGVTMFIYVGFLTWRGYNFILDSTAFITVSVLLYIVKDRLKEGIRSISSDLASKWFPDYTTKIKTPDEKETIGKLKEFFTFTTTRTLPQAIKQMRETEFHTDIEKVRRQESVMYYKKEVILNSRALLESARFHDLNDIIRFNINPFLLKASDPIQKYLYLDQATATLTEIDCPKVYHINIIMKNTFMTKGMKKMIKIQKLRLVVNKEGIERIERLA